VSGVCAWSSERCGAPQRQSAFLVRFVCPIHRERECVRGACGVVSGVVLRSRRCGQLLSLCIYTNVCVSLTCLRRTRSARGPCTVMRCSGGREHFHSAGGTTSPRATHTTGQHGSPRQIAHRDTQNTKARRGVGWLCPSAAEHLCTALKLIRSQVSSNAVSGGPGGRLTSAVLPFDSARPGDRRCLDRPLSAGRAVCARVCV